MFHEHILTLNFELLNMQNVFYIISAKFNFGGKCFIIIPYFVYYDQSNLQEINTPSSTAITADIGNGNYRCSSASDDIGKYRPDIAVLPGIIFNAQNSKINCLPAALSF